MALVPPSGKFAPGPTIGKVKVTCAPLIGLSLSSMTRTDGGCPIFCRASLKAPSPSTVDNFRKPGVWAKTRQQVSCENRNIFVLRIKKESREQNIRVDPSITLRMG